MLFFPKTSTKANGTGYQLALLALAAGAAVYARTTMAPLQEAVRIGLSLTDSQMGLLQGPAIALPLLLVSFPLGLAIDWGSRVRLARSLLVVAAIGCVLTAVSRGFQYLVLARGVVGLATMAINPVVLSLIADLYEPSRRGRALMVVGLAQLAALSAAFGLGGEVLALCGPTPEAWRSAMLYLTAPLVPAVAAVCAMREPTRRDTAERTASSRGALPRLWHSRPRFLPVLLGIAAMEVAVAAVTFWTTPALMRTFSVHADRAGELMAVTMMISGIAGPLAGGCLADRLQRTGGPGRTLLVVCGLGLLSAPAALFPLLHNLSAAAVVLVAFVSLIGMLCVMGTTVFIVIIPGEIRGLCTSILTVTSTLAGGMAPVVVSALSDGAGISIQASLSAVGLGASLAAVAAFAFGVSSVTTPEA